MKFCIITHTHHHVTKGQISAYAPYVREMNLWLKSVDFVTIVAPETAKNSAIFSTYEHQEMQFERVPAFSLISFKTCLKTLWVLPKIAVAVYKAMKEANHIHLRCPGNMGLVGCLVQILFPKTPKSVKYAGNWDPKAKQPWSYTLQKWILSNTFLTNNCEVLVYGEWPHQSKNIKPFFTATYSETEKRPLHVRDYSGKLHCLFVGTLVKGKQPLKAIQMIQELLKSGREVRLDIYGEGGQRAMLENYIQQNELTKHIHLKGNQPLQVVKEAYQKSHFLILPSISEGWPKVVAEAMFWGCIPITTPVSCVPWMLHDGARGFLITSEFKLAKILEDTKKLQEMRKATAAWSRQYTLEKFENALKTVLLT